MRSMYLAARAAAAVAFCLVGFAAPAAAQNATSISGTATAPVSAALYSHDEARLAETGAGVNDTAVQPLPASPQPASPQPGAPATTPANAFSQLFGHAVQAIGTVEPVPAPPQPVQFQKSPALGTTALADLVATYVPPATLDADQDCLASAIYFESR